MRKFAGLASVAMAVMALAATPASAAGNGGGGGGSFTLPACDNTDISPTAISCAGFYDGNLINGSPDDQPAILAALNLLGGYTGTALWSEKLENLNGSMTIDFNTPLNGLTYIGIHFGAARGDNGPGAQATAFYKFNALPGQQTFTLDGLDQFFITQYGGSSNAALFFTGDPDVTTAVPEPASWAMMILAAGFAGASLRRKRRAALLPA